MYEWIKYKVAAEIGDEKEQEAFALYEKIKIDEMGEIKYRLMKESAPRILWASSKEVLVETDMRQV